MEFIKMQKNNLATNNTHYYSTSSLVVASSNSNFSSDWVSLVAKGGTTVLVILAMTLFVRVFLKGLVDLLKDAKK